MNQSNILPSVGATLNTPGHVLEEAFQQEKNQLPQRKSQFVRASFCVKCNLCADGEHWVPGGTALES